MKSIAIAITCVLLAGCVSVTADNVAGQKTESLCLAVVYGNNGVGSAEGKALALAELQRRREFTPQEIGFIARSTPAPGMSERAGLCAWGFGPTNVNTTVTAGGTRKQFVFGDSRYGSLRFLYSTNGIITAVQS